MLKINQHCQILEVHPPHSWLHGDIISTGYMIHTWKFKEMMSAGFIDYFQELDN